MLYPSGSERCGQSPLLQNQELPSTGREGSAQIQSHALNAGPGKFSKWRIQEEAQESKVVVWSAGKIAAVVQ